ncbi:unnamed protein product, partial [Meganyctiphanes norvegica]
QSLGWSEEVLGAENNGSSLREKSKKISEKRHRRLSRSAASAGSIATSSKLSDAHSLDIVYSKNSKGDKSERGQYRGGSHNGSSSMGVLETVVAHVSPNQGATPALPSAAEPPSHPVSLE